MDLWRFLEETKGRVSFITGCPGVGKSMEVYAYAMYEATERKKRVLYIHGNKIQHHYLFTSGGVEDARIGISVAEQDTALYRFVYNQLVEQKVDMIVLDGALEWLIERVYFNLKKFPNVRLISCTSFQAVSDLNGSDLDQYPPNPEFDRYSMESWTREELAAALKSGVIHLDQSVQEFNDILFYSGGSVRMVKWTINKVIDTLNAKFSKSVDIAKLVGEGVVGDASESAVNTLIAIYDGCKIPVSQYVTRKMTKDCTQYLISKYRMALPKNPVWQGWVTEIEVLTMVRENKIAVFWGRRKEVEKDVARGRAGLLKEEWPRLQEATGTLIEFYDASDDCFKLQSFGWFAPLKFNQQTFDAIYWMSPDTIRFIQITNDDTHSCKLQCLIPYVQIMNVHVIEVVYVCQLSNFDTFKVPSPDVYPAVADAAEDTNKDLNEGLADQEESPLDQKNKRDQKNEKLLDHNEYLQLECSIQDIYEGKLSNGSSRKELPHPAIIIRHVTYEDGSLIRLASVTQPREYITDDQNVVCECGISVKKRSMKKHLTSKRHLHKMEGKSGGPETIATAVVEKSD